MEGEWRKMECDVFDVCVRGVAGVLRVKRWRKNVGRMSACDVWCVCFVQVC